MTTGADAGECPRRRIRQSGGIRRKDLSRGQQAAGQEQLVQLAIPLRHALVRQAKNAGYKGRGEERSGQYCLPVGTRLAPEVQRCCQRCHGGSDHTAERNPDFLAPVQLRSKDVLLGWRRNDRNTFNPASYRVSYLVKVNPSDDRSTKEQHVTKAELHGGTQWLSGNGKLFQIEAHWQAGNHRPGQLKGCCQTTCRRQVRQSEFSQ